MGGWPYWTEAVVEGAFSEPMTAATGSNSAVQRFVLMEVSKADERFCAGTFKHFNTFGFADISRTLRNRVIGICGC